MTDADFATEEKSSEHLAFLHYLRTGERLTSAQYEQKFNQNHDRIGRFTDAAHAIGGSGAVRPAPSARHHAQAASRPAPKNSAPAPLRRSPATPPAQQATRPARTSAPQSPSALQREGYTPWNQVGSHPARVYQTKVGAAIIDPRSGNPMLVPQGVSIRNTVRAARMFGSTINREPAAASAFRPGGPLDFQRTHSTLRDKNGGVVIDQRFIAIGNYNFGVYAAASGMSLDRALDGAAAVYFVQTGNRGGNRKNESLIVSGYRDYRSGNVGD